MKQYFTPMLLTAGGIDITVSQEGDIGTGSTEMWVQFAEWGITQDILNLADDDPGYPGYTDDPESWMTLYEWLYNNGYVS